MTTVNLDLKIDNRRILRALEASPKLLRSNMEKSISRIIQQIARSARKGAPKANSTLTNSIRARRINALSGIVRPGVNYAPFVEEGTGIYGPAGNASGKLPPLLDIWQWVRVKRIQPKDPSMTERDLAFAIARSIASKGTKAQPYMQPALEANEADARKRINDAITKTLQDRS